MSPDNSGKLILSLFDFTGNWARPYVNHGYAVQLWDLEHEGDILLHFDRVLRLVDNWIAQGGTLWGILSAPPCTLFCRAGARWRMANQGKVAFQDYPHWSRLDVAQALVDLVLHLVELYHPHFWALENPAYGRLEKLRPELTPFRRLDFDPCDFGDPITKRTAIYGNFARPVESQPCLLVLPDVIHNMRPGPDRAAKRSATPEEFAQAFFHANP